MFFYLLNFFLYNLWSLSCAFTYSTDIYESQTWTTHRTNSHGCKRASLTYTQPPECVRVTHWSIFSHREPIGSKQIEAHLKESEFKLFMKVLLLPGGFKRRHMKCSWTHELTQGEYSTEQQLRNMENYDRDLSIKSQVYFTIHTNWSFYYSALLSKCVLTWALKRAESHLSRVSESHRLFVPPKDSRRRSVGRLL